MFDYVSPLRTIRIPAARVAFVVLVGVDDFSGIRSPPPKLAGSLGRLPRNSAGLAWNRGREGFHFSEAGRILHAAVEPRRHSTASLGSRSEV